uniref:Secreted protein n=1 Tax=Parascaris univalens TaxID=6257 RepID=A0A915A1I3_PARUN
MLSLAMIVFIEHSSLSSSHLLTSMNSLSLMGRRSLLILHCIYWRFRVSLVSSVMNKLPVCKGDTLLNRLSRHGCCLTFRKGTGYEV